MNSSRWGVVVHIVDAVSCALVQWAPTPDPTWRLTKSAPWRWAALAAAGADTFLIRFADLDCFPSETKLAKTICMNIHHIYTKFRGQTNSQTHNMHLKKTHLNRGSSHQKTCDSTPKTRPSISGIDETMF